MACWDAPSPAKYAVCRASWTAPVGCGAAETHFGVYWRPQDAHFCTCMSTARESAPIGGEVWEGYPILSWLGGPGRVVSSPIGVRGGARLEMHYSVFEGCFVAECQRFEFVKQCFVSHLREARPSFEVIPYQSPNMQAGELKKGKAEHLYSVCMVYKPL